MLVDAQERLGLADRHAPRYHRASAAPFVGASDTARPSMGGFWVPDPPFRRVPNSGPHPPPLVWREPFPSSIQRDFVSFDNPSGSITNSDLELAGVLCHQDILAQSTDCCELTFATLCDNTLPSPGSSGDRLQQQLCGVPTVQRLFALHRRHHRYLTEVSHIPGVLNAMADDASRLWHLSDTAFLS
jgi:hypothetical protein